MKNDKDPPKGAATLAVPSGRGTRLARLGWMATGIAGGMVAEGARQLAQGNRPKISDMLLTPANLRRVADQLAKLRMSGLLPRQTDLKPLLRDAKRQWHEEADYIREGKYLRRYDELLQGAPEYAVPRFTPT